MIRKFIGLTVAMGLMASVAMAQGIERTARPVVDPTRDLERLTMVPTCAPGTPVAVSGTRFVCGKTGFDGFEPAWLVGCMWNWSGKGNDTSMYIFPITKDPVAACGEVGRSYQYHYKILAESYAVKRQWFASAWVCNAPRATCSNRTTHGTQTRTVECRDGLGNKKPDEQCASLGEKPSTSEPCVVRKMWGCGGDH